MTSPSPPTTATEATDPSASAELGPWLDAYVQRLQAADAIRSPAVARAFGRVPRHRLLDEIWLVDEAGERHRQEVPPAPDRAMLELIYDDTVFFTCVDARGVPLSSSTRPSLMARMLERLELRPGLRVLEIGTGTGYNAALISELVADTGVVATMDIHPEVIAQTSRALARAGYGTIDVRCRDGFEGCPERAPFDRVVATVCCTDVSPRWLEQLAADGIMLIPLQHGGPNTAPLLRLTRAGEALVGRVVAPCRFMSMHGALASVHPWAGEVVRAALPPAQRRPALPELPHRATGDGRADLEDFHYFLGLEDPRTCRLHKRGVGLWDEGRGFVFSTLDEDQPVTLLYGDEGLYREYRQRFDRWSDELCRPRAADFESELRPSEPAGHRPALRRDGEAWVIERQFFAQRVTLGARRSGAGIP